MPGVDCSHRVADRASLLVRFVLNAGASQRDDRIETAWSLAELSMKAPNNVVAPRLLPAPVQRCFDVVLQHGGWRMRSAQLTQEGEFLLRPPNLWRPFTAMHRVTIARPDLSGRPEFACCLVSLFTCAMRSSTASVSTMSQTSASRSDRPLLTATVVLG
jgi:hypothetical protein